jgi:hypothetical protein
LLGSVRKPVCWAIHSYVVEPIAIAPTLAMNRGNSSSNPLGSLNWKCQLSELSESAIEPSMLLAV